MTESVRAALDQLSERYSLPPTAADSLEKLSELLAQDPEAATTVREAERILDDHVADSLVALDLPSVRAAETIADLGSGAGVPGLVLAAALPEASVALVESNGRKAAFLERAAAASGLGNAVVVRARVEQWHAGIERCDLVTARALAPLDVVAEYAAPLLRIGGSLVVWRGAPDPDAEAAGRAAAVRLGLEVREPVQVRPYPRARNRYLHVMSKVMDTPPGFPRRPGIARKRPLGSKG